ncbi:uncharacterized protein [Haliotis asinina]|uniref:uncharacterized protein n=1 Tax=Haliotis asinina TaxID=109174 RepID=UPI003531AD38
MAASLIVWLACMVFATEAVRCHRTHHCSDCDRETGDCITDCDTGYYDRQCKSNCSVNCRNNTCVLSSNGNDNCTYGCVPGYQGTGCNIPCDNPEGGCTACPGGCDGGYCQLGSTCVSGCVDSYYGTGYKNSSSGSKTCNRLKGTCNDKLGHPVRLGLYVGLSVTAALSLTINLIVCCKCCQRSRKNSVPKTKNVVKVEDPSGGELEWYTDIPLTDIVMSGESAGSNCGGANGAATFADDVYNVAVERKGGFPVVLCNTYSKLSHDY